jgi:hypothetical protein
VDDRPAKLDLEIDDGFSKFLVRGAHLGLRSANVFKRCLEVKAANGSTRGDEIRSIVFGCHDDFVIA